MRLQNKVALVTASTRGIGWAIVQAFAREGAVVYMAVRNLAQGEEQAARLCEEGYHVRALPLDSLNAEDYPALASALLEREGRLDILVNNFGTGNPAKDLDLLSTPFPVVMDLVQANLSSVYLACQAFLPAMIQQGGGSIVNLSSIGGLYPELTRTGYGLSKSGVSYLTKQIAVQYARQGVRCNAILPGMIATDSVARSLPEEYAQLFQRHTPIPRMGRPEEIASAALWLASDESSFVTGQLIPVSGGFGLPNPLYGDSLPQPPKA